MSSERPNVLYIFTDQQAFSAMSCAGNLDMATPAMDSVAESGVLFERAYCTYPLCSPSRSSMFTGLMPHETGVTYNNMPIREELREQELGHVLSEGGYECVYGGKWHIPEIAIPEGHGFRSICGFDDTNLADHCIEFIRGKHEAPFFLVASYDNPHNICEWSRNQVLPWGPIPEATLEECPNLPTNYAPPPYEPQMLQERRSNFPAGGFGEDDWRRYRHAYFRLVEKVDAEMGRILGALEDEGLRENTVIVFSSDHGDGMGAHRWNQKWSLYEESVHIPLLICAPGVSEPGRSEGSLVSNGLDLYPTICDYAGVEPPEGLPGGSLRPLLEGGAPEQWRDQLVIQTAWSQGGPWGRAVVGERYKYCMYTRGQGREQLFDLDSDPGEMVDLSVESRYRSVLQRSRDGLAAWIAENDDHYTNHYSHPGALPPVPGGQYAEDQSS